MRWIYSVTILSVILSPLITQVAFGAPISSESQSPQEQSRNGDVPLCYMQTGDGRIINLQKLCGKTAPTNTNVASNSDFRVGSGGGYYRRRSREDH